MDAKKSHRGSPAACVARRPERGSAIRVLIAAFASLLIVALTFDTRLSGFANDIKDVPHIWSRHAARAEAKLLQVLQVHPPVLGPGGDGRPDSSSLASEDRSDGNRNVADCVVKQELMKHVFANSYDKPFIGRYTPPACAFNRVSFKIHVKSAGRQFDRLGIVYLGDTEIWRTSTAEPTQRGIEWTYVKDMSQYLALLHKPQKLIFDLGNLIDDTYTAPFNFTLTATFFRGEDTVTPADVIFPVSLRNASEDGASAFQYPKQRARNSLTLPRNVRRAVFTIASTGQINEEFWFANVLESYVNTFGKKNALPGHSPFREVQLLIDGELAGVAWPFYIIFTGGVVPGFWRPVVGIDAFDLREDEIDVTPWLPLLCDGKSHTFEIVVAGIDDDGHGTGKLTRKIGSYWVLTGKLFLWLDAAGSVTTGSLIRRSAPEPNMRLTGSFKEGPLQAQNTSLSNTVRVHRRLSISSTIQTTNGTSDSFWFQDLHFSNEEKFTRSGNKQITKSLTTGVESSSTGYARNFTYPVNIHTSYAVHPVEQRFSISGRLRRGQKFAIAGQPVFPTGLQSFKSMPGIAGEPAFQGTRLRTYQNGTAHYSSNLSGKKATGYGSTEQGMVLTGFRIDSESSIVDSGQSPVGSKELYRRHILAINETVVKDKETLVGEPIESDSLVSSNIGEQGEFASSSSVRRILGRGPAQFDLPLN